MKKSTFLTIMIGILLLSLYPIVNFYFNYNVPANEFVPWEKYTYSLLLIGSPFVFTVFITFLGIKNLQD